MRPVLKFEIFLFSFIAKNFEVKKVCASATRALLNFKPSSREFTKNIWCVKPLSTDQGHAGYSKYVSYIIK